MGCFGSLEAFAGLTMEESITFTVLEINGTEKKKAGIEGS
jgi:hypothetical protein